MEHHARTVAHRLLCYSDWLVGNATAQSSLIPTLNLTNGTTYSGSTSFGNYTYQTDALYLSGILQNDTDGLNHASTVGGDGVLAVDGLVAVLTIKITATPPAQSRCAHAMSYFRCAGADHNMAWNSGSLPSPSSPTWLLSAALLVASFALSLST